MFTNHKDWIVTLNGGYAKLTGENYEDCRQQAFAKFGQDKCSFFYPLNTTGQQQIIYKNKTGCEMQTAENIIEKYDLKEVLK